MPELHRKFGGSNAARVLQCPGYLYASRNIPKGGSSIYAERGTQLHDIQEKLRTEEILPEDVDIYKMFPDLTSEEVSEYAELTDLIYDWTEDVLDNYDIDFLAVEPFVTAQMPDTGGSIDLLGYGKDYAVLQDYKFGSIPVHAEDNAQGLFYFMCVSHDPKYQHMIEGKKLVFVIQQPALGQASIWEIPQGALELFETRFREAQALALTINPPLGAGAYCKFCPKLASCPEYIAYGRRAITMDPKDKTQLTESLFLAEKLDYWSKQVFSFAQEMIEHGESVTGYKLVAKRASRSWINVAEVEAKLKGVMNKEQYFKHTLLTPPQIEKLKKVPPGLAKFFEENTQKVSSGLTLAKESDKREAVRFQMSDSLKEMGEKFKK